MIKITKPKFWDNKRISLISILLLPLSLITLLIIFLKKKLIKEKVFKIPLEDSEIHYLKVYIL